MTRLWAYDYNAPIVRPKKCRLKYRCRKCGEDSEFLVMRDKDPITCKKWGGDNLGKLMSADSSLTTFPNSEAPLPDECCGAPNTCGRRGNCCS